MTPAIPRSRLQEVIVMVAGGLSLKEIAGKLGVARHTAEYHWAMVRQVYGFACYQDAADYALTRRWVSTRFPVALSELEREELNA
jgi:DNA-binding NarL/FixJ family response regulator